ncbi:hypothetical protein C9E81_15570 [Paracoccus alkanivorans]|uniref:Uncharacterized protein n=2 Tax=Paracoccus alkanivorans TaxID=2116655 RepID=A0A3M0MBR5_9RHOB|nr:hypothetical protein C9E81_15570 [Paracoccus alkanivorans]
MVTGYNERIKCSSSFIRNLGLMLWVGAFLGGYLRGWEAKWQVISFSVVGLFCLVISFYLSGFLFKEVKKE